MIYLDNAAATKILPCAFDALDMAPYANPNSSHALGQEARFVLEQKTNKIKKLIGANTGEIYFFPTATAAAQNAIYSACVVGYATIRYDTEHHSVGDHTFVQSEICDSRPANGHFLHCRMHSNNETGEIYPAPSLPTGDFWLCDATSSVGHVPVDVEQLGCHYLVADALKFGGIPGCAFLWVADGAPYYPIIEGGTPSVGLICAMAAALEWHTEHMTMNMETIAQKRNDLLWLLEQSFPGDSLLVNTPRMNSLPHILNISFDGVDGKTLAMLCSKRGMMISAGAACTSGNNEPSHVLMAMYRDEARARSAVRISFSHENTVEEAKQAAKIIAECVEELRSISC